MIDDPRLTLSEDMEDAADALERASRQPMVFVRPQLRDEPARYSDLANVEPEREHDDTHEGEEKPEARERDVQRDVPTTEGSTKQSGALAMNPFRPSDK